VQNIVREPEFGQVIRIVLHNVEFTDEQTDLQRFLRNKKEEMHSAMENAFVALARHDALRVKLHPELLAHGLMSYLHGLIHEYLTPGQRQLDLKRDGDALLDLILNTLLARQS